MLDFILPNNPESKRKVIRLFTRYGSIVMMILYIVMLFQFHMGDTHSLHNDKIALYIFAFTIPLMLFMYVVFSKLEDKKYLWFIIFGTIFILLILFNETMPSLSQTLYSFINYFISYTDIQPLDKTNSLVLFLTMKLILVGLVIVGLSVVFQVLFNESLKQKGLAGLVLYSIFYIPCLVSNVVKYWVQEFGGTPTVVFVLLAIEAVLLILYFALPKILKPLASGSFIQEPMFFYNSQFISDAEPLYTLNEPKFDKTDTVIVREYCISMWITTNYPQYAANEENPMFVFARQDQSDNKRGCPYIACKGDGKWKFVVSNSSDCQDSSTTVELRVPMQTWNYVVLNYRTTQVDIFINGKLRSTLPLEKNCTCDYDKSMGFTVGKDGNTLHGAICNLHMQKKHMDSGHIARTYNLLKLKNPPVNNLF